MLAGPGPGPGLAWPGPGPGPPEAGGRLIGGAGAVAPAQGGRRPTYGPMFPNLENQILEKVSKIMECQLLG